MEETNKSEERQSLAYSSDDMRRMRLAKTYATVNQPAQDVWITWTLVNDRDGTKSQQSTFSHPETMGKQFSVQKRQINYDTFIPEITNKVKWSTQAQELWIQRFGDVKRAMTEKEKRDLVNKRAQSQGRKRKGADDASTLKSRKKSRSESATDATVQPSPKLAAPSSVTTTDHAHSSGDKDPNDYIIESYKRLEELIAKFERQEEPDIDRFLDDDDSDVGSGGGMDEDEDEETTA